MKSALRKFATVCFAMILVFTVAACGNSDSDTDNTRKTITTVALETKGPGKCDVDMSGAVNHTINGKGGISAISSDYWYSTARLQKALDQAGRESASTTSDSSAEQKVANGQFVITGLILNCFEKIGDHYSVDFTTTSSANRSNFPFEPKSYALTGDPSASILNVLISAGSRRIWKVSTGTLDITQFDKYGIAGTFKFDAVEDVFGDTTPNTMHVDGVFDLPCAAGDLCEKRPVTTTSSAKVSSTTASTASTSNSVTTP